MVYEEDQFGNLETGDSSSQVTASLATGKGPLLGTTTLTLSDGVARFSDLSDNRAETIKLAFSRGTILSQPSTSITVGPAGAAQLVLAPGYSTTATAGQPLAVPPTVSIVDAKGNVETGDNSTKVTVSLASGPGSLGGTTTVTVQDGVATFPGLYDQAAGTITLSFSATDGLTAGPSTGIVIGAAAPDKLVITTQPSANASVGQAFVTQPVVKEEDQYGNVETGDSSTVITAALATGTGPLLGTTALTLQDGVAAFTNLYDQTAETITLVFTGGKLTSPASDPIAVTAGTATQLVIQTGPYATVTAGTPLTDPIVIYEEDKYGNLVTSDNTTQVTASLASGAGTLIGTKTVTVQGGIASFDDLEDDKAGTLTLQFSAGTLPSVESTPSLVTPAAASTLTITSRPPGGIPVGTKFTVTVNAVNPYGNVDTNYGQPVTLGLAAGSAGSLGGTLTMTADAGVVSFTDLSDTTSGSITLDATSGQLSTGSTGSATVALSPGVPSKLVIQTQPAQTATAGQAFVTTGQPVVVEEEDQYGNLETGDNTTTFTVFLGSGAGPLQGDLAATLTGGVATFSDLYDDMAGTITLAFTGGGLTSLASVPIVISPAGASQLLITTPPSTAAAAGAAFSTQPVIEEEDKFGNLEIGDDTTLVTAALASGTGPLQGDTEVTLKGGVAAFADLSDQMAETITLSFSARGLSVGTDPPHHRRPGRCRQAGHPGGADGSGDGRIAFRAAPGGGGRGQVRKCGGWRQHDHGDRVPGQRDRYARGRDDGDAR